MPRDRKRTAAGSGREDRLMQLEIFDVGSRGTDRWLPGWDSSEGWEAGLIYWRRTSLGLFTELKSLPVEQIRKVALVVNLKVARALGVPRLPARPG